MSEVNIFETAIRNKYRFPSTIGDLTTEQLWDLDDVTLNKIGLAIDAMLSKQTKTFLKKKTVSNQSVLENKLAIVTYIISVKEEEEEAKKEETARKNRLKILTEALGRKQDSALENMSEDDIIKQIEETKKLLKTA